MEESLTIIMDALEIALGLVFALSAAGKILNPRGFLRSVGSYRLVPSPIAHTLGIVLIPTELVIAVSLLTGVAVGAAASAALVLFGVFMVATSVILRRHQELPCMCFGSLSGEFISRGSLARLSLLTGAALLVLLGQVFQVGDSHAAAVYVGHTGSGGIHVYVLELLTAIALLAMGRWVLLIPDLVKNHRATYWLPNS